MTEEQLRQLVRDAIERHLGRPAEPSPAAAESGRVPRGHASHARFPMASGADLDGPCLIEPAVSCVHCGYCLSYGH